VSTETGSELYVATAARLTNLALAPRANEDTYSAASAAAHRIRRSQRVVRGRAGQWDRRVFPRQRLEGVATDRGVGGVEQVHQQRVELASPDGALYRRFASTFTWTGRPVSVITRLPVTASAITDSGLYGEWCAEVFLYDEDAPIARRRFVLTPP